jgi:glycosyltransferase involved in cell wall biosynthesis
MHGVHIYRYPTPKERSGLLGYLSEYLSAIIWQSLYAWWIYLRHGFQVIQGCNPPDDIFLVALPFKLFGVKYIFDHHDSTSDLYLAKYGREGLLFKVQLWLERLTYRFSDVVIATNSSYRDLALNRGGIHHDDVFIVRNGPNLDTFKAVPPCQDLSYGKRYLVGYVGNMDTQDGLDILLDVALHIKSLGRTDVHFTCVGGGPALGTLRELVLKSGLSNMVNFTGRVPDSQLMEILSTADVCVNPDRPCRMNDISTMIKIMEYMALGKPIVQFDMKEGRLSAQESSLYADNNNQIADFAAKLLWLLDNPDARRRMGQLGKNRVAEELAWEYSIPHLLAAYEKAFSKRVSKRFPVMETISRRTTNINDQPD